MRSRNLRMYDVDGKNMVFNVDLFKELFSVQIKKLNVKVYDYENSLAEKLYVDRSSIHNWRMKLNGPGDLEKIQLLAEIWGIDYKKLLTEVNSMVSEVKDREILDEREMDSINRIYASFYEYMENFKEAIVMEQETNKLYWLGEDLNKSLDLEYFNLPRNIYNEISDFFDDMYSRTSEYTRIDQNSEMQAEMDVLEEYFYEIKKFKELVDKYRR